MVSGFVLRKSIDVNCEISVNFSVILTVASINFLVILTVVFCQFLRF